MKSLAPRIPLTLILISLFFHPITTSAVEGPPSSEPVTYSAQAVREDLAFLYQTLEASIYDLFLNTSRTDYDRAFKQATDSIMRPMTDLEVSRMVRPLVVLAGFSHCTSYFPSEAHEQFHQNGG